MQDSPLHTIKYTAAGDLFPSVRLHICFQLLISTKKNENNFNEVSENLYANFIHAENKCI